MGSRYLYPEPSKPTSEFIWSNKQKNKINKVTKVTEQNHMALSRLHCVTDSKPLLCRVTNLWTCTNLYDNNLRFQAE